MFSAWLRRAELIFFLLTKHGPGRRPSLWTRWMGFDDNPLAQYIVHSPITPIDKTKPYHVSL